MARYAAILRASLRETFDQRFFYVILAVLGMFVLLVGGTWVETASPQQAAEAFASEARQSLGLMEAIFVDEGSTWDELAFRLEGDSPSETISRVRVERAAGVLAASLPEDWPKPRIEVSQHEGHLAVRVRIRILEREWAPRVRAVRLFFFWRPAALQPERLPQPPMRLYLELWALVMVIFRWVGIPLMVMATAGFVPSMLRRGAIDLLLSRPVHRVAVVVAKYACGLLYVAVASTAVVVLAWLLSAWGIGIAAVEMLVAIPVLVATFAILYAVSVLFGIWTRSGVVAGVMALVAWMVGGLVATAESFMTGLAEVPGEKPAWLDSAQRWIDVAQWLVPPSSAVQAVFVWALEHAAGVPLDSGLAGVDWLQVGITSVGFITVMLILACVSFARQEL